MRTYNGKGVTIPSQKRYIRYFQQFLDNNWTLPYYQQVATSQKTKDFLNKKAPLSQYMMLPEESEINSKAQKMNVNNQLDVSNINVGFRAIQLGPF